MHTRPGNRIRRRRKRRSMRKRRSRSRRRSMRRKRRRKRRVLSLTHADDSSLEVKSRDGGEGEGGGVQHDSCTNREKEEGKQERQCSLSHGVYLTHV